MSEQARFMVPAAEMVALYRARAQRRQDIADAASADLAASGPEIKSRWGRTKPGLSEYHQSVTAEARLAAFLADHVEVRDHVLSEQEIAAILA